MRFKNAIGRYKKPGGVAVAPAPTPTPTPTLATLTLSGTLTNGTSSSGTINGATTASTIVSNVSGLTVNSGARTYAWDGTGAAGTTSNGLVETLAGATGSPKSNSITVAAAAAIDTPVLANLASGWTAGQNPPAWQSTYTNVQGYDPFDGAGDQVRARWRLDGGAWTTTAWEPLDDELATGDAVPWPFLTDGSLNAGGVFDVQEQIVRDLSLGTEQFSAWSSSWTDTISAAVAVATWDPAAKSAYITLSNGDKTATAPASTGGVIQVIGTTGKTTGKWYFEVAVTLGGVFHQAGVGLANSLPPDDVIPGSASSTALTYHNNGLVYRNSGNDGGANQASYENPTGTYITGVAFDADADKVWFALANTYGGSPSAGTGGHAPSGITTYYPLFMTTGPTEPATIRTLTADMTYSPPSGFSALGGA